jgi:hypothetical protein
VCSAALRFGAPAADGPSRRAGTSLTEGSTNSRDTSPTLLSETPFSRAKLGRAGDVADCRFWRGTEDVVKLVTLLALVGSIVACQALAASSDDSKCINKCMVDNKE